MIANAERQSAEYAFPYHHLPYIDDHGLPHLGRAMRGGLEYLAYLLTVVDLTRALGPERVLDVGCGDGRLLAELGSAVPVKVGVDLDGHAIAYAASFAPTAEVRCEPIDRVMGTFDVVTCVETLEHVADDLEEPFLQAVAARVSPGGRLMITVPSTARPVHEKHHRHYSADHLRERIDRLPGSWYVERLEEIVGLRQWLESGLRLITNRHWTLDVPLLNRWILGVHRRPVPASHRGSHVLAVVRRAP